MQQDRLTAIYDLRICPETFDIVDFMSMAESKAEGLGVTTVEYVIYAPRDIANRSYAKGQTGHTSPLRLSNILLQSITSLESSRKRDISVITSYSYLNDKWENSKNPIFPEDYSPEIPTESYSVNHFIRQRSLPKLQASSTNFRKAENWLETNNLDTNRLVTITLRESGVTPERNSDTKQWLKIANELKAQDWSVLLLRDTDLCFQELPVTTKLPTCPEASLNIGFRSAIYHHAKLNVHLTGGPSTLCITSPSCAFLYFFKIVVNCGAVSLGGLIQDAFLPGSQWPLPSSRRRTFWECESTSSITSAILTMLNEIGSDTRPTPECLIGSIESSLESDDLVQVLSQSSIAQTLYPQNENIAALRFRSLRRAQRSEEALLFHIHFRSKTKYRNFNYPLQALHIYLSSHDFEHACQAVETNNFKELPQHIFTFIHPEIPENWKKTISFLLDTHQYPRALEIHRRVFIQQKEIGINALQRWEAPLKSLNETGKTGTAIELANALREKLPCPESLSLAEATESRNTLSQELTRFLANPKTNRKNLTQSIRQYTAAYESTEPQTVVVYGTGAGGLVALETCRKNKCVILAFCQTPPPSEKTYHQIPLLSLYDTIELSPSLYLIASETHATDMLVNLLSLNVPQSTIALLFPSK